MENILFEQRYNNENMPESFNVTAYQLSNAFSMYNEHKVAQPLHVPLIKAICRYMDTLKGGARIGIGKQGDKYIAEYQRSTDQWCLAYFNKNSGKFFASHYDNATKTTGTYKISDDNGELLFFVLMPLFYENSEFRRHFNELMEQYPTFGDNQKCADHIKVLCDNAKCRMELPVEDKIATDISLETLQTISSLSIRNGTYIPNTILAGNFEILIAYLAFDSPEIYTAKSFLGHFKCGDRKLAQHEIDKIPMLKDWFQVPKEAISVCRHFKALPNFKRNLIIRGPSGIGKSGIAKAVAAGMYLPFDAMTFSTNADEGNIIGRFMHESLNFAANIPTFSEIHFDPPSAYYKMTGKLSRDITEDKVIKELARLSYESGLAASGEKTRIVFKESPLIDAIRSGYVIELQEAAAIRQPGTLIALNGIMDDTGKIHLESGETVERHPETIIIFTSNVDYAGVNDMDQSVLGRCKLKFDLPQLTEDEMIDRAMLYTGCGNDFKRKLENMARVIKNIQKHCNENDITEGVCGYSQFLDWVLSTLVTNDPYYSAKITVVPSTSANPEIQQNILSTCVNNQIDNI